MDRLWGVLGIIFLIFLCWLIFFKEPTRILCPHCKKIVKIKNAEKKDFSKYFKENFSIMGIQCPRCKNWFIKKP
jgi:hypothetical protein